MDPEAFRQEAHRIADWIADYFAAPNGFRCSRGCSPATSARHSRHRRPSSGESFDAIFADFERIILPGITHWNHPGFFAYFAISGSAPGVLAEFLSAALNVQAMLWRTSPAATELEEVSLGWLRQLIGLPDAFEGVIYDTASISTLHALAAAREAGGRRRARRAGSPGATDLGQLRVYCSEHAHSSVDKAVILLGLGHEAAAADRGGRRVPDASRRARRRDRGRPRARRSARSPSSRRSARRRRRASIPVGAIASICARERIWLHVDAAYAGVAAMRPRVQLDPAGRGRRRLGRRQSAQVAVHAVRSERALLPPHGHRCAAAFSLTPEYLKTSESSDVRNLMDTGIQLGRRFRALKLWMVLRHFGAEGIRDALAEHIRLARLFAGWVDASARFRTDGAGPLQRRLLPRARQPDELNERLLERINASGEIFLSHTRLDGRYTLRLAIGNLHTTERHVARAWELIQQLAAELEAPSSGSTALSVSRKFLGYLSSIPRRPHPCAWGTCLAVRTRISSAGSHHAPAAPR